MCLGVPGKVLEVYDQNGVRMAQVDFGGVRREVCLAYVPEVAAGDYTIVHVGFAISRLDEAEALATLALLQEIGAFEEEFGHPAREPGAEALDGPDVEGPG